MSSSKNKRAATIRKLARQLGDEKAAAHVYDNILTPALEAEALRAAGHQADVTAACVDPAHDPDGWVRVSCMICGRTATVPQAPPEGMAMLCPQCRIRV